MTDEEKQKTALIRAYTTISAIESVFSNYCGDFYCCEGCPLENEEGGCLKFAIDYASREVGNRYFYEVDSK